MEQKFHVEIAYPWSASHWERVATLTNYNAAEKLREHWERSVAGVGVRILPESKVSRRKRGRNG